MTALKGVRVLELSEGAAGAIAGMFLGDHGADVIKVEPPQGDWARSAYAGFEVWNRNKRGVVIDKTKASDLAWVADQVKAADVVIVGYGELADWGDAAVEAAEDNPELVLLRQPGYLDGYTPWVGIPESSGLLNAYTGLARRQSSWNGGPVELVTPYVIHAHGLIGATGVVAALVERLTSGRGQTVTATGMQAMQEFNVLTLSTYPGLPDPPTNIGPISRHPTYRHFETVDGRWFASGALGPKFEAALLRALGLGEKILDDERIHGVADLTLLPENQGWVNPLIVAEFKKRTVEDLYEMMSAIGIPCGAVDDRDTWLDHPQIVGIGMRAEVTSSDSREIVMPGVPVGLLKTPGKVTSAAPVLGEHSKDGLPEPWSARPAVDPNDAPRYVPGPLHGIKVLNMGTFVATPYSGYILTELGATVIKVEPVTGDPFRASAYGNNRGMRSLAINLQSEEGQKTFHRLAKTADVVIDGMRPGVLQKLNLDWETLAKVNKGIVSVSLSAYGEGGPDSARPGVDMVIQAESGMMSGQGGDGTPVANTVALNDVTTGCILVLTAALALYSRGMTGEGQRAWNALAATSAFLQDNELVRWAGSAPGRTGDDDYMGEPFKGYTATKDGWVYADADPITGDTLEGRAADLVAAGLLSSTSGDLAADFAAQVAKLTSEEAAEKLNALGIRAAVTRTVTETLHDPRLLDAEAYHIRVEDTTGTSFMMTGRQWGFSRTQRRGPLTPPGIGEHTRDTLRKGGLADEEIDALIEKGVIVTGEPFVNQLTPSYR